MELDVLLAVTAIGKETRFLGLDWNWLVLFGLVGNCVFSMRFIVQWIASEKAGDSVIPPSFWYWSISGSIILSLYFIFQRDPVGILANLPNSVIYLRNLALIRKKKRALAENPDYIPEGNGEFPYTRVATQWAIAIALFAGTLFLCTRHIDYPYYYEKDAHSKVAQVVSGERNFLHPPLMTNAADLLLRITGKEFTNENAIIAGRQCMAFFTAVAVAAFSILGFRLWGAAGAICVGLLVMSHPLLFDLSHHFKEDPALIFGLGLSFVAFQLFWEKRSIPSAIGMGVASALAVSGKYVGAAAIVMAIGLMVLGRERIRFAHWYSFFAALLVTLLVVNYQIIQYDRFIDGFKTEMKDLTRKDKIDDVPQFKMVGHTLDRHIPLGIAALIAVYVGYLLTKQRRHPIYWLLFLYPALFTLALLFSPRLFSRHFLPIFVCTSAMAGLAIPILADLLKQSAGRLLERPKLPLLLLSLILLTPVYLLFHHKKLRDVYKSYANPSRNELIEFINNELPPDAVIAFDWRAFLLKPDRSERTDVTIERKVVTRGRLGSFGTVADLYDLGVTHLVSHATDSRPLSQRELSPEKLLEKARTNRYAPEFYTELIPLIELKKDFRGGHSAYVSPALRVYELKQPRPENLKTKEDYQSTASTRKPKDPEAENEEE